MSFISVVVRSDFLSIVSDGRITKGTGEIVEEYYKKFTVFNNNFVVGACGNKQLGELVRETLFKNSLFGNNMVSVLHYVMETMAHISKHESVQLILYFGGIVDGQIHGYFISSKNNELTTLVPTKSQVGLLCNMSSEVDQDLHDKFMYEVQCTPTAEKMIEVQKKYNDIIATYDNSVNTTHYEYVIKL